MVRDSPSREGLRQLTRLDDTEKTLKLKCQGHPQPAAGRHADGQGLYLVVHKRDTRSWTKVLRVGGRRLGLGLGAYPEVSLKEARCVAMNNPALAKGDIDPRHPKVTR